MPLINIVEQIPTTSQCRTRRIGEVIRLCLPHQEMRILCSRHQQWATSRFIGDDFYDVEEVEVTNEVVREGRSSPSPSLLLQTIFVIGHTNINICIFLVGEEMFSM